MAVTPSTMLALGTAAPGFTLPNPADGTLVTLPDFDGHPALLVMFICNHCPFVVHVMPELRKLQDDYMHQGLAIVAINANSLTTHAQDGPEHMKALVAEKGWTFPFLFDESQDVAKAYTAACTPDFFLFDSARRLAYRGQLDDSRPSNGKPVTGRDLRAAIERVLEGEPPSDDQRPSIGCNIKWHPGTSPA